jgi:hypothetical protein
LFIGCDAARGCFSARRFLFMALSLGLSLGVGSSAGADSGGSFFTPTYQIIGADNSLPNYDSGNTDSGATPTTTVTPTTALGGNASAPGVSGQAATAPASDLASYAPWIAVAILAAVLIFKGKT